MSWSALEARFGAEAVALLATDLRSGASPLIEPTLLAAKFRASDLDTDADALLEAAAADGLIEQRAVQRCPAPACGRMLDTDELDAGVCSHCGNDYRSADESPIADIVYRGSGALSRSVPWVIAVHGFNTLGAWQEEISWRIANRFKYHAPVLIYKYGLIRFSVLARWRHRQLARALGRRIRGAIEHAVANQISAKPDILVHSFGSQLFRVLLEMPEFSDLRFGRVIVCGSIIRPDFDWSERINNGRIEAVLAHLGGKDRAVPFAQFFIPGSGPGARHGYPDPAAINVRDPDFVHSGCFSEAALAANLARGGTWDRFLREPLENFDDPKIHYPGLWTPAWRPVRGLVGVIGLALLFAATAALIWLLSWTVVASTDCAINWIGSWFASG